MKTRSPDCSIANHSQVHPVFLTCALDSRQGARLSEGLFGEDPRLNARLNVTELVLECFFIEASTTGEPPFENVSLRNWILASMSAKSRQALLTSRKTPLVHISTRVFELPPRLPLPSQGR